MFYHPRRKSARELLELVGFTHTGPGMGWERPPFVRRTQLMTGERLHATFHHGYIQMHYDLVIAGRHESRPSHKQVRQCMEEIRALDRDWRDDLIDLWKRSSIARYFKQ